MKITNHQILETAEALNRIPALIKAPKATHALGKNSRKLTLLAEGIQEDIKKVWDSIFDKPSADEKDPRLTEFNKQRTEILKEEQEFEPHLTTMADLNFETNSDKIQPADLGRIAWLISDFDA